MSGEGPSDLPQFYGGKTADGEMVKRPREGDVTALGVVASPIRAYHPRDRGISPDRGIESDPEAGRVGLRRRPSGPPAPISGEYDTRPSYSSRRPMRIRDEAYWDERDYERDYRRRDDLDYQPGPTIERSRSSRYRPEPYSSKPYFEETRSDYYPDDEPRTPKRRRPRDYDEESLDGYNYDQHRRPINFRDMTKEERQEVLTLPWSAWMNSDFKNR